MTDKIKSIMLALALVAGLAGFTTTVLKFNSCFARADALSEVRQEIAEVNKRIDIMRLEDELTVIQKKMWAIEDRWTEKYIIEKNKYPESIAVLLAFMPDEPRKDYRDLEARKVAVEKKLKKLREE